jgi:hypothetical protein
MNLTDLHNLTNNIFKESKKNNSEIIKMLLGKLKRIKIF